MLEDKPSARSDRRGQQVPPVWSSLWRIVEEGLERFPPLTRTMKAERMPRDNQRGSRDVALALLWGAACHSLFAAAVLAMIVGMWFGMSLALGGVPHPWHWLVNLFLLLQFPLAHSILLTARGQNMLNRLAPFGAGGTLATTTYATLASVQLIALFVFWTPSGIMLWQATGWTLWMMAALYASSWLFLIKASWDAGAEVQSGLLGWASLLRNVKPQFPPMPEGGTFKLVRQPIYLAFALTTWTVPTWTADQILVACVLTTYCVLGPLAKERRFARRYGQQWSGYKARTPYWVPLSSVAGSGRHEQLPRQKSIDTLQKTD